jgi:HPr kinase/phosphorylase
MRSIHVEDLLREGREPLGLKPLAGLAGLGRTVSSWKVSRPGKALSRQEIKLRANRPLILGRAELEALRELPQGRRRALIRELALMEVPCLILEGSIACPEELLLLFKANSIPLLSSSLSGTRLNREMARVLRELLGPPLHVQGVLLRVFGLGVLIVGRSGIGKSECALDLIDRGHCLVADDFVELSLDPQGRVRGRSPELIRYHMEVRGLGILNIRELFGPDSVRESSAVDLVVEFMEWEQFKEEDRTGLIRRTFTLLDKDLPLLRMPVSLNRNIAILMEVAVRNHLLGISGRNPLKSFDRKIQRRLQGGAGL